MEKGRGEEEGKEMRRGERGGGKRGRGRTFPTKSCVRVSRRGAPARAGLGDAAMAILMTASMSSLLGAPPAPAPAAAAPLTPLLPLVPLVIGVGSGSGGPALGALRAPETGGGPERLGALDSPGMRKAARPGMLRMLARGGEPAVCAEGGPEEWAGAGWAPVAGTGTEDGRAAVASCGDKRVSRVTGEAGRRRGGDGRKEKRDGIRTDLERAGTGMGGSGGDLAGVRGSGGRARALRARVAPCAG